MICPDSALEMAADNYFLRGDSAFHFGVVVDPDSGSMKLAFDSSIDMHVTLARNFPYDCHAVTDGGICWSPWRAKEHPHEASTMGAVVSVLATNPPPESKTSNDSAENVIALPLGRASRTSLMITWEFQVSRGVCTSDAAHRYYWGWAEGFMSASNWGRIAAGRDSKDPSAAPGLPNAVRWMDSYCSLHPQETFNSAVSHPLRDARGHGWIRRARVVTGGR